MKGVDRAVARYGASAVGKYYTPRQYKPELKYFDCSFAKACSDSTDWSDNIMPMANYMSSDGSTVSVYTGGAIIPSAVGNGYGQVVGNKYVIRKLKVRGVMQPEAMSAQTVSPAGSFQVRLMLVQDTQPNGAQIQASAFMTDWGSSEHVCSGYMSISSGAGGRIRILADKYVVLEPAVATNNTTTGSVSGSWNSKTFTMSKTWKKGLPVVIKSGGSTPAVAQLSDMNIFLVYAVRSVNSVNVRIIGCTRCSYYD